MPNEEYLDYVGLARFLNKIREKDLKNRARNYVINPSETLSSEYLNSSFKNTDDMSVALRKSSNGTDFKLKDVDGNDILIKDLKLGDLVSIKQISDYYPERFVGLIDNNFVHFYAYSCLAFNHIVQGSMKPVTSGAVYNALLPFNKVSTTTTTTTALMPVPASAKGLATFNKLGGMSYKCSNLFNNTTDYTIQNANGVSINVVGNTATLNGTSTGGYYYNIATFTLSAGTYSFKEYILSGSFSGTNISLDNIKFGLYDTNISGLALPNREGTFTLTQDTTIGIVIWFGESGITFNNLKLVYQLNEGTTALPYEAYYEGIRNSAVTKLLEIGTNRWDEEWEVGGINSVTGANDNSVSNRIRSKNYIKVKPSTTYYLANKGSGNAWLFRNKADKTLITYTNVTNTTFTTSSDCEYVRFCLDTDYGTTYNHDICINVSNAEINGKYYPYSKHELAIPSEVRALEGYGWGVNDSCYNYVDFTLKQYCKYVGRVDLGSLNWYRTTKAGLTNEYKFISIENVTSFNCKANTTNYICSKYLKGDANEAGVDKVIAIGNYINIADNTYTDATAFKNAMSGVYLYFELATPTATDISAYLPEQHLPIEPLGTIEPVNTYGNAVPMSVTFDNGLSAMVKTNHEHDIEQQKEIDFLLRGGNLKTVNGQSLVGSGNISITVDISHRYCIGLYDSNYTPIFIAFLTDAEQESYDPELAKSSAIGWIKAFWEKEQGNDIWYTTDVTNDAGYYSGGTGIVQTYEGLIGVVYDESQGSGSETITAYFANGTTQQIALSDIGDTPQDNYFFRVF